MPPLTDEHEAMKRAIWDKMSPRRKKFVERMGGYDVWDPFQEPKDPIDIRKDSASQRTAGELVQMFMRSQPPERKISDAFYHGVQELAFGLLTEQDPVQGMYEFSVWYYKLLKKEGRIHDE